MAVDLSFVKKHWIKIVSAAVVLVIFAGVLAQGQEEDVVDLLVRPRQGPFQVAVTSTGELQAQNSVKITGPSNAMRMQIYQIKIQKLVAEGTVVNKGQFVAELDRSELASRIAEKGLELEKAMSQWEQTRLDTLLTLSKARDEQVNLRFAMEEAELQWEGAAYEAPSVKRQAEISFDKSKRAYEQAVENYKTQVAQSRAKMREVEATLNKAKNDVDDLTELSRQFTVLAPENGMVIYKRGWNGQKLTEGGTLQVWDPVVAELPDLSLMESVTYVNEVDIQKIKLGQTVNIGLDADPNRQLSGIVQEIANIGEQRPNSDAKVFQVKILIHESDTTLRPAMTTSNEIVVAEIPDATYIPLESVHTADSLNYVYLRSGTGAVRREVRLGTFNEDEATVEAGLDPNDQIYISLPADTSGLAFEPLEAETVTAEN